MTFQKKREKLYDEALDNAVRNIKNNYHVFKDLVERTNIITGLTPGAIDQLNAFKKAHRKHYDRYCLRYSITESPKQMQHIQNKVATHERLLANGL